MVGYKFAILENNYEGTKFVCVFTVTRKKTYFRSRPRAVATSIDLKLRRDVVHHVVDAFSKFRVF